MNSNEVYIKTIGEIAYITSGKSFPKKDQGESTGEIPFYKVSDMNLESNRVTMTDSNNYVSTNYAKKIFPKGSIIFPKVGGAIATNKKRILSFDSLVDNNIMVLIPKGNYSDYLYYYFLGIDLMSLAVGTTLPALQKKIISDIKIYFPSIDKQKQIVSKIKECFTLLDKSKEKLKQAEEKLNNVLDSSLLSLQRTNGDVYPLKDIVTIQKQTIKLDINSSSFYIALEDIEANTGKLLNTKYVTGREVKSTKLRFNTKHVLYSKLRPYLNKVIIPPEEGICVTDLLPLLPNEKVTQKYLYYYLRSPQIRDYINQKMAGIKMPRLRTEDLNNMPIFVPSIETQNNFVTRIERLTEEAYQCRISIEKQAKKQELLRQLLLKKAFEGKLI